MILIERSGILMSKGYFHVSRGNVSIEIGRKWNNSRNTRARRPSAPSRDAGSEADDNNKATTTTTTTTTTATTTTTTTTTTNDNKNNNDNNKDDNNEWW